MIQANKKKKKKEPINKKKLNDENIEIAKLIAKTRDKYTCCRCGKKGKGMDLHGSHTINEAADHRLASDPDNIIALCYHCHINRRHKNPLEASKRYNEKYPWSFDKLQAKHIEYMSRGSISITWVLDRNKRLRELAKKMDIDLSKYTYGLKRLEN